MCKRIANNAGRAAATPARFMEFCAAIEKDHFPVIRQAFLPVLRMAGQSDHAALEFTRQLALDLVELSGRTTAKTLAIEVEKLSRYWLDVTVPLFAERLTFCHQASPCLNGEENP
jgi:hypothetical protein